MKIMKNMKNWFAIVLLVIGLGLLPFWTYYWYQKNTKSVDETIESTINKQPTKVEVKAQEKKEKIDRLRFKNIGKIIFKYNEYNDIEPQYATIYLDTETGIKYMYFWAGMANGGPVMTRLWEKE